VTALLAMAGAFRQRSTTPPGLTHLAGFLFCAGGGRGRDTPPRHAHSEATTMRVRDQVLEFMRRVRRNVSTTEIVEGLGRRRPKDPYILVVLQQHLRGFVEPVGPKGDNGYSGWTWRLLSR
jgi:hypothetical protein